jgi:hypothetical protein
MKTDSDPYITLHGGRFDLKRVHDPKFTIGEDDKITVRAKDSARVGYIVTAADDAHLIDGAVRKIWGRTWQIPEEDLV